jgi:hypothetical protein
MRAFVAAYVAAGTNHWLGRVLVANMPGSVVFIGFALAMFQASRCVSPETTAVLGVTTLRSSHGST